MRSDFSLNDETQEGTGAGEVDGANSTTIRSFGRPKLRAGRWDGCTFGVEK